MNEPLLSVYNRLPITMVKGEGVYLIDEDGRRYLDFAAGIGVNSMGHCHPYVVDALEKQVRTLWHCSNRFHTPQLDELAERLVGHTFADKVFFTNSGSEAVETGIKMIRRFQASQGYKDRYRIITMEGGFHGRTMGALSACGYGPAVEGYGPMLPGFDQVAFNDLAAAEAAITPQTAGILVEPIQSEGGIRVADMEYLRGLRRICDTYGLVLFLDEVQTGMSRTGTLFAFERAGITPDICAVAKGIGTGFPLGACLAKDRVAMCMTPGSHGGTYGGNPLACAAGNAVLDMMLNESFLPYVNSVGKYLKEYLVNVARFYTGIIEEVRGTGLMLGLRTKVKNTEMAERLLKGGLITVAAQDNVVRILPPLVITFAHVDEAMQILHKTCEEWA